MSDSRLVKLKLVQNGIPRALQTIYNLHHKREIDWLSRLAPGGKKTRDAWVDLDLLTAWAKQEGIQLHLEADQH